MESGGAGRAASGGGWRGGVEWGVFFFLFCHLMSHGLGKISQG